MWSETDEGRRARCVRSKNEPVSSSYIRLNNAKNICSCSPSEQVSPAGKTPVEGSTDHAECTLPAGDLSPESPAPSPVMCDSATAPARIMSEANHPFDMADTRSGRIPRPEISPPHQQDPALCPVRRGMEAAARVGMAAARARISSRAETLASIDGPRRPVSFKTPLRRRRILDSQIKIAGSHAVSHQ